MDQFRRSRAGKKPPTGYYASHGTRLRAYLDMPRTLEPLASSYVVVETADIRGSAGATSGGRDDHDHNRVDVRHLLRLHPRVPYEERASVDMLGQQTGGCP